MSGRGYIVEAIAGWRTPSSRDRLLVGCFVGEGVGAEIVPIALDLLRDVCERVGRKLEIRHGGLIGKPAIAATGKALTDEATAFCNAVFAEGGAILCGPGGGRFVYELRAHFDLFCKLTPLVPLACLGDAGCLRPERLAGVDILAVRENTGGLYLGESLSDTDEAGEQIVRHCFQYTSAQVRRILESAFTAAAHRRCKVCVTVKPGGVPAISRLWQIQAEALAEATGIELSVLEIDNAVYQLIAHPLAFDVVVSPNMFGDVLADAGSLLLGSRGMSYSGNFGAGGRAVYQTGHGAAHDLAGMDRANPIGQALSVAMMLRESFALPQAADLVLKAIESVVGRGMRTADIAGPGSTVVGTREMGRRIVDALGEVRMG